MRNPLSRKPQSPIDQALAIVDNVRADAAGLAGTVRDAATKAADALGDAAPATKDRRIPLVGAAVATGAGIAVAVRCKMKSDGSAVAVPDPAAPSAAKTASRTTAAAPKSTATKPAAKVEAEKPVDPKAETAESEAAAG